MLQKSCFKNAGRFFTSFFGFFRNFFFVRHDFTKAEHFLNKNMENISIISKTFPEQQTSCKKFLMHCSKSDFNIFKRQKYSFLTKINDNCDNNEKKKMFKNMDCNIPCVNFPGGGRGDSPGGNLMVGNFFKTLLSTVH